MNHAASLPLILDEQDLETRFAMRVAARLSEHTARHRDHIVDERLRVAREKALERARLARRAPENVVAQAGPVLALAGAGRTPWWTRAAALVPLAVLLGGLALINIEQARQQIEAAAQVDAELLADDLPPTAYSDPGFLEFLKRPQADR